MEWGIPAVGLGLWRIHPMVWDWEVGDVHHGGMYVVG